MYILLVFFKKVDGLVLTIESLKPIRIGKGETDLFRNKRDPSASIGRHVVESIRAVDRSCILDGSPPLHRAADDGSGPPVRPPRRLAAAHPLLRAGQGGCGHRRALPSGAVNLDTRSYDGAHGRDLSFEKRESFLAGAAAALARAQGPVRRLAVDVVAENPFQIY